MSIVIGDFEVVNEPAANPSQAESATPAQAESRVSTEAFESVERHLTERALRVWAD